MTRDARRHGVLSPVARLLWRSDRTIQLELGGRAVVVDGLAPSDVRRLVPGRGSRTARATERSSTDRLSTDRLSTAATRVVDELSASGFLWPATPDEDDPRMAPPEPRLAAELAALSAQHGSRAAELLNARQHYAVSVHGTGRVGPHVAAVLAAAGVGRVHVLDRSAVKLHHAMPGGVSPDDEGTPLSSATAAAVLRSAPLAETTPLPLGERPDLVVLAIDEPIDGERRDALHARECAHLVVRLGPDHGVVGPLVIPGLTSCLHCADLHRLDRDPAWTALAVQLSVRQRTSGSTDVALATVIAGLVAGQALAFLDGGQPAAVEGTLEVYLPDWRVRRRSWPVHPDCDCTPRP